MTGQCTGLAYKVIHMSEHTQKDSSRNRGYILIALLVSVMGLNISARIFLNMRTSPVEILQTSSSGSRELININTASAEQLTSLPGIGPVRAEDIILYREENNGFKSLEDIMNIKGIGKKTFDSLSPFLRIGP